MVEIIKTPSVDLNIDEFTYNVETDAILGTVTGDGIFDTLMETATKHLLVQFESNRIRQEDYANAYIHIYEVTLQAALKAWLEKDLVAAQIRQIEAGTAKIEAETAKTIAEMEIIQPQIAKIEAETGKIIAETELLPLQKDILLVEKAKVEAETTRIENEVKLIQPQIDKLEAETAKTEAEKTLIEPQISKLNAETSKTEAETTLLPKQLELLGAQVDSEKEKLKLITKQLELLAAQILAEQGKADLYERQIQGFDDDYKHKVLKIMMDSWAVGFSVAKDNATISVIPDPVTSTKINSLYAQIAGDITT